MDSPFTDDDLTPCVDCGGMPKSCRCNCDEMGIRAKRELDTARAEAAMLREATAAVLHGIKVARDIGCIRYLDAWDEAPALWHKPIEEAQAALSGSSGEWLERNYVKRESFDAINEQLILANGQTASLISRVEKAEAEVIRIGELLDKEDDAHELVDTRCEMLKQKVAALEAERDGLAQKLASEKESRVKYQDIVYAVCNSIDSIVGRNGGLGVLADKGEITTALARIKAEARRKALLEVGKLRPLVSETMAGSLRESYMRGRNEVLEYYEHELARMAQEADHA